MTRFGIAHELGHILLHSPYSEKDLALRNYEPVKDGATPNMFRIKYGKEEEIQADLFAAIVCQQYYSYDKPIKYEKFVEPCYRLIQQFEKAGYIKSDLIKIMKNKSIKDCRVLAASEL